MRAILIVFLKPGPQSRRRLTKRFRVQLGEMQPRLHPVVKLVGFQFPHRDAADEFSELTLVQRQKNIRQCHKKPE